jgi:hypothetical protein
MAKTPRHIKTPREEKAWIQRIRWGMWTQAELEWLLRHMGKALTPAVATEIRYKLRVIQETSAMSDATGVADD